MDPKVDLCDWFDNLVVSYFLSKTLFSFWKLVRICLGNVYTFFTFWKGHFYSYLLKVDKLSWTLIFSVNVQSVFEVWEGYIGIFSVWKNHFLVLVFHYGPYSPPPPPLPNPKKWPLLSICFSLLVGVIWLFNLVDIHFHRYFRLLDKKLQINQFYRTRSCYIKI